MQYMSNASKNLASIEAGLFNQITLFSVSGLVTSMAFIFAGGLRIVNPWF